MKFEVPHPIRIAIYVVTALGTPIIAYLQARHIIGPLEVALWSAEVAAAGALAIVNVTPTEKQ